MDGCALGDTVHSRLTYVENLGQAPARLGTVNGRPDQVSQGYSELGHWVHEALQFNHAMTMRNTNTCVQQTHGCAQLKVAVEWSHIMETTVNTACLMRRRDSTSHSTFTHTKVLDTTQSNAHAHTQRTYNKLSSVTRTTPNTNRHHVVTQHVVLTPMRSMIDPVRTGFDASKMGLPMRARMLSPSSSTEPNRCFSMSTSVEGVSPVLSDRYVGLPMRLLRSLLVREFA